VSVSETNGDSCHMVGAAPAARVLYEGQQGVARLPVFPSAFAFALSPSPCAACHASALAMLPACSFCPSRLRTITLRASV